MLLVSKREVLCAGSTYQAPQNTCLSITSHIIMYMGVCLSYWVESSPTEQVFLLESCHSPTSRNANSNHQFLQLMCILICIVILNMYTVSSLFKCIDWEAIQRGLPNNLKYPYPFLNKHKIQFPSFIPSSVSKVSSS